MIVESTNQTSSFLDRQEYTSYDVSNNNTISNVSRTGETVYTDVSRRPSTELALADMIDFIVNSETQLLQHHQARSDLAGIYYP